ncbi:MAG: glycosyltransferase [Rhodothermaceae bacterium]|nr:glycosyltransferase [Rhodothermaceae bacterium]
MIVCDLTHAYTPTSGGIRTYIDAKRRYVLDHTEDTHVLVIPGEEDTVERGERWVTVRIKSPVIPGAAPYRFFLRRGAIVEALTEARPDVTELNSLYFEPWAAFRYREQHPSTLVSGYYFTDVPGAYIGPAVRGAVGDWIGAKAERTAERYIRRVFDQCDIRCAPSPAQAERLTRIGVEDVNVIVPGVDLETFAPERVEPELRTKFGIPENGLMLFYGGRLDSEKRIYTMTEAVAQVNARRPAKLVMAGNGPYRDDLETRADSGEPFVVLPYQTDKLALASLMATADLYLTAGPHETFALSVVEAQACGLPVVGVAAGALVERVHEGIGRLGPVDDAEAMAANILAVANQLEAMGAASRCHVEERFSWKATFDALFDVYRAALASQVTAA